MATNNKRKTTSSSSRGRKKPAKKQAAPIRREVGACVCLVLALLTVLCCFRIDAAILNLLGSVFRGLIGAGFYILPFSFVMSFLILILHDGRPVALRVTCTFLTAALVGSLVQLVGGSFDAPEGWEVVTALWDGGISGTAGGVLSGGLASLLAALISVNLGILNLLPIPILDGGHIVFFTLEMIMERPVSATAREWSAKVGMALLLGLMILATWNDLTRLFS